MTNQTIKQQKGFKDLKHCTCKHKKEVCLGQSLDKPEPYPRWIESVFWVSVTAVFAVSIFGFISIV